jgi:pyruvate formate lyase activating enzyme
MMAIGRENEKAFFDFLKKRVGLLDGVCVTGGEPTVQPDLIPFLERIKGMGFFVKLDSNGLRPEVLREVLRRKLADHIAMDIKHAPGKYPLAMGVEIDMEKIKESVEIIKKSGLPYEFRTTVVPGIHTEADFEVIGKWIRRTKNYYLQPFRDDIVFDPKVRDLAKGKSLDFENIKNRLKKYGIDAVIRG